MSAAQERCYCDECRDLDRMRLQGIPGTFQMRLIGHQPQPPAPAPFGDVAGVADLMRRLAGGEHPDQPPAPGVAGLPLFDGSLEPVLF